MEADAVVPESAAGTSTPGMLYLTSVGYNGVTLTVQRGIDSETAEETPLFHPAPHLILLQPDALGDLAVLYTIGGNDGERGNRLLQNEAGHVLLLHHPGADMEARAYL